MPFLALGTNLAVQVGGQGNVNTLLDAAEMDVVLEAFCDTSGMVYYEMRQPSLQSNVEVYYHGTLTDGTVFDSSVDRGQTISFPLGGVINRMARGIAEVRL
jgi:hypothetical protein